MANSTTTQTINQVPQNRLGTERIGKLIKMYAVPSIISMLVNSLYNIVDQIFIGWGVGYLGNGATNIIFPITIVFAAFALMFGDGSSAYMSLMLGANKKTDAAKGVANGIILSVATSILFAAVSLIFFPQLLQLFGCTPELEPYAKAYGYIIILGLPFQMVCATINSVVRADGSPKYAMVTMLIGAVMNVILDPIFIFVFDMGVQGAAIATVISQILSFLLNVLYLRKLKSIELKKNIRFSPAVAVKVSSMGVSSFITQMFAALVMGMQNNLLKTYGAASVYGSEIPITVLGIVVKVNEILNSVILGLAMGSSPIIGYNYGAQKYDRVKKTLKTVILAGLVVSTFTFLLFQTVPDKIILLFGGSDDSRYIEFAKLSFRIYMLLIIGNSVQTPIGIFLQAIGRSGKSSLLSLSKQALFQVPGMLLLGRIYGVVGVLAARPVSDGLSCLLALVLLGTEFHTLRRREVPPAVPAPVEHTVHQQERPILVTISREYGSGGRYVGQMLADQLGVPCYDKELILELAKKTGLSAEYIERTEEKRGALSDFHAGYYTGPNQEDDLFIQEAQIIEELAGQGPCVIIGRCADYILEGKAHLLKIFIYSTMAEKVKRATTYYGLSPERAEKEIKRIDRRRAIHYEHYTNRNWADRSHYDIYVNSDFLGVEKTADLLCALIAEKLDQTQSRAQVKGQQ